MSDPTLSLDEILSRALRRHPGVVSAYLFGSAVRGRAYRESDIDASVLLDRTAYPTERDRFEMRLRLDAEIGSALRRNDVDLVILNDTPPQLAREIVTRGRRICCADRDIDHAFVRTMMLRAADLEPFLRRTRRVKIEALGR